MFGAKSGCSCVALTDPTTNMFFQQLIKESTAVKQLSPISVDPFLNSFLFYKVLSMA